MNITYLEHLIEQSAKTNANTKAHAPITPGVFGTIRRHLRRLE